MRGGTDIRVCPSFGLLRQKRLSQHHLHYTITDTEKLLDLLHKSLFPRQPVRPEPVEGRIFRKKHQSSAPFDKLRTKGRDFCKRSIERNGTHLSTSSRRCQEKMLHGAYSRCVTEEFILGLDT